MFVNNCWRSTDSRIIITKFEDSPTFTTVARLQVLINHLTATVLNFISRPICGSLYNDFGENQRTVQTKIYRFGRYSTFVIPFNWHIEIYLSCCSWQFSSNYPLLKCLLSNFSANGDFSGISEIVFVVLNFCILLRKINKQ
jgi:hypothetical protein